MTTIQKKKLLCRIQEVEDQISELKKTRAEIAASGYQSATMSSGGGSKSYTKITIAQLTEAISSLTSELKKLKAMLKSNLGGQSIWHDVLVVYDL